MDFKLQSRLSRIDYHLNQMTAELFEFIMDNKKDLTDDEYDALMESYKKFDEGLMTITDKVKF